MSGYRVRVKGQLQGDLSGGQRGITLSVVVRLAVGFFLGGGGGEVAQEKGRRGQNRRELGWILIRGGAWIREIVPWGPPGIEHLHQGRAALSAPRPDPALTLPCLYPGMHAS